MRTEDSLMLQRKVKVVGGAVLSIAALLIGLYTGNIYQAAGSGFSLGIFVAKLF